MIAGSGKRGMNSGSTNRPATTATKTIVASVLIRPPHGDIQPADRPFGHEVTWAQGCAPRDPAALRLD